MAHPASNTPPPHPRHHHVPPGTGTFGMTLFLIALGMLFAASILGYVLVRLGIFPPDTPARPTPAPPPFGVLDVPATLWLSTGLILLTSVTIHRAYHSIRLERQAPCRRALLATLLLAVAFLLAQVPALLTLLDSAATHDIALYGFIFFLILIHALHLLGGLIPLTVITWKAHAGRYDHEHYAPIKYLTMYWHFLDAVWLAMFATFLLTA